MTTRTVVALILLTGPPLCLFAVYLRDHGFVFKRADGWGVLPILAVMLLLVHAAVTLSAYAGQILNAEFFPSKGFLFFLVSGVAFSVAIFPQRFSESTGSLPKNAGINLNWMIAIPAWIWILVVMVLATLEFSG